MIKFAFILADGSRRDAQACEGDTVMQVAYDNAIDGIAAECGGSMSCGTCHVFLDQASFDRIAAPTDNEVDMLDLVPGERHATSRLSCQIHVDASFAGAEVHVPERQF